ncbi:MAG: hypothetical protein KAT62_10235 [Desulfuromonadales bacterium]|nr:hypothetical protein [Desulfuromonadales bacterium]
MKRVLFASSLCTLPLPTAFKIAHNVDVTAVKVIIHHEFEYGAGKELFTEVPKVMPGATLHAPFFAVNGWGNMIRQLNGFAKSLKQQTPGAIYPPAGPKNQLYGKCGSRFSQNDNFQIGIGLFAGAATISFPYGPLSCSSGVSG